MLDELTKIGFTKAGSWALSEGEVTLILSSDAQASDLLYAFVVNDVVKYLGKTSRMLKTRMRGYWKPGARQSTNIRNYARIKKALQDGMDVSIYVLTDVAGLTYEGHAVNLADGLEPSLIQTLQPAWNDQGKNKGTNPSGKKNISKEESMPKERLTVSKDEIGCVEFLIKLGKAYYNQGFFNIRVDHERYFDGDGAYINIFLEDDPEPIRARIDRRANPNGVPRIMAGKRYRDWAQSNFRIGDKFCIRLLSDGSMRLKSVERQ